MYLLNTDEFSALFRSVFQVTVIHSKVTPNGNFQHAKHISELLHINLVLLISNNFRMAKVYLRNDEQMLQFKDGWTEYSRT